MDVSLLRECSERNVLRWSLWFSLRRQSCA